VAIHLLVLLDNPVLLALILLLVPPDNLVLPVAILLLVVLPDNPVLLALILLLVLMVNQAMDNNHMPTVNNHKATDNKAMAVNQDILLLKVVIPLLALLDNLVLMDKDHHRLLLNNTIAKFHQTKLLNSKSSSKWLIPIEVVL
jgi:hypothetical protein